MVMAFGREVWLSGDVGASSVLEKETAVPPFKIRLEHVLELRLAKIFFRVDNGNFVYERFKFFFEKNKTKLQ